MYVRTCRQTPTTGTCVATVCFAIILFVFCWRSIDKIDVFSHYLYVITHVHVHRNHSMEIYIYIAIDFKFKTRIYDVSILIFYSFIEQDVEYLRTI